jgi:hypothetical protein
MPLSSGQVSLSEIQSEFGGSNPISLSEYYRTGSLVPNISSTSSIPTSSTISVGNFRSTSSSPIVNGFTSTGDTGQDILLVGAAVSPSGVFIAVGGKTTTAPYGPGYATSSDGINWSGVSGVPGMSDSQFSVFYDIACRSDGLFVAVGAGNNNSLGIFSQSGGGAFNAAQAVSGASPINTLYSIGVSPSGLFVAGGFGGRMFYSGDGYNWAQGPSNGNGSTNCFIQGIVCRSDGRWVGVGGNGNNRPAFSYSNDGVNWSTITNMVDIGVAINMKSVTVSPKTGRFVAVASYFGRYPFVAASDDGINWSYNWGFFDYGELNAVRCNRAGVFVAAAGGRISTTPGFWISSTDGLNWTSPADILPWGGTYVQFRGLAVNNYVGTSGYGRFAPIGSGYRGDFSTYTIYGQQS